MTFETFYEAAMDVWRTRAPSYVQADVIPAKTTLRELYKLGATVDLFDEGLQVAFASKNVTKRSALYYAYGVVKRLISEGA